MSHKLKEINIHITDVCNGHCPMCYATEEGMCRSHGDLETLKKVIHNAIANGEVERYIFVGGDPCAHPHLVELLKYIKEEGNKYNIKTKTIVLSNTHDYKENGKPVSIEEVAPYIDEMDVTVHGANAEEHDAFNGVPGSYEHVMKNILEFGKVKTDEQEICAIINIMPHTVRNLEQILLNTALKLDGKLDFFGIQRIAPSGRALPHVNRKDIQALREGHRLSAVAEEFDLDEEKGIYLPKNKFFIRKIDVNEVMKLFKKLKDEKGFNFEFVDVFPWCTVKPEYREMLPEGGCNWGTEVCAVFSDGSVKRCAMSENSLTANMADLDTPEKFAEFWNTDPELQAFREKKHLDERCKACEMLQDCGGSCTLAREDGDPYKCNLCNPIQGHDYLATQGEDR